MKNEVISFEKTAEGFRLRASCRSFEGGLYRTVFAGALCWIPFQLWWDLILGVWDYEGISFWATVLFLGVWAVGSMYAVDLALMALFGEVRITRRGDLGEIFVGIGPAGWTRHIRWSEFQRAGMIEVRLAGRGGHKKHYVVIEGPAKRIKFGWLLPEEQQAAVAAAIEREVFAR